MAWRQFNGAYFDQIKWKKAPGLILQVSLCLYGFPLGALVSSQCSTIGFSIPMTHKGKGQIDWYTYIDNCQGEHLSARQKKCVQLLLIKSISHLLYCFTIFFLNVSFSFHLFYLQVMWCIVSSVNTGKARGVGWTDESLMKQCVPIHILWSASAAVSLDESGFNNVHFFCFLSSLLGLRLDPWLDHKCFPVHSLHPMYV